MNTRGRTAIRADFVERYGLWGLVTGAAQGIGAAYADRLHTMGMPLVLVDVATELLEAKAAMLRTARPHTEVRTVVADLADPVQVHATIDAVADLEIGLLVANAGIGGVGLWLDVPIETKVAQIAINCTAVLILADRLTRLMAERRRGGVIVMASGSADMGSSYIATYAATKAFDRVLAEALWAELSPYGIDVTAVMPGATKTPGFDAALPAGKGPTRLMTPGDPAAVVQAALAGLGRSLNVRPGGAMARVVGAAITRVIPRATMLRLGDRAVRALYDR